MRCCVLCCSDVCLWAVPAGPGPPSRHMVWGSTVPGAVQQTSGRERGKRWTLSDSAYVKLTRTQNSSIALLNAFFPSLRIWIIPSCLVTRQPTSMNVPSGLFWRRTCFCTSHSLTMRKWVCAYLFSCCRNVKRHRVLPAYFLFCSHRVAWSTRRSTASIINCWPLKTSTPRWSTSSTWSLPGGQRASSRAAPSSKRPGRIHAHVTMFTWLQHWWNTTAARWGHI